MENGFYLYSDVSSLIEDIENELPVWCEKGRIRQVQVNTIATTQDGFVVLFADPEESSYKIPTRYAYSLDEFYTIPFCKELPALSHFIDVMKAGNYWDFYNLPISEFNNIKNIASQAVKNGFKPKWPVSDEVTTPPPITALSASWDHITSKIILTWTPVSGAPLYRIYYNTGTNVRLNSPKIESLFGNTYHFPVNSQDIGKTFYFRIQVQYPGVNGALFPLASTPPVSRTTFIPVTVPSPEINLQVDSVNILDGQTYNFGTKTNGTVVSKIFVIQNLGTANLAISNITITGSTKFTIPSITFPLNIAQSGTYILPVTFVTDTDGVFNSILNIFNNDSDESTYNIGLEGEVVAVPVANMDISTSSLTINNLDSFSFGGVQGGQTKDFTFNVKNTGDAILNISGINITGLDAALFSVVSFTNTPINPGSNGTIVLRFAPIGLEGTKNANVVINSNDPDSPFTIAINGFSYNISPKLEFGTDTSRFLNDYLMMENNNSISNGGTTIDKVFKIFNSGNGILQNINISLFGAITNSIAGITPVQIIGSTSFVSILPGQSQDITLRFNSVDVSAGSILGQMAINSSNGGNISLDIDYYLA